MPNGEPDDHRPSALEYIRSLPRELIERIASGAAIGMVAFVMLYWSPKAFAVLTFLVASAMSWEWGRMVRGASPDTGTVVHIVAVLVATVLAASDMAGLGIAVAVVGAIVVAALGFGDGRAQLSGAGVLYTGLPVVALGWLRGDEPLGFLAVLFVLLTVVVTDVAAYAAGRSMLFKMVCA